MAIGMLSKTVLEEVCHVSLHDLEGFCSQHVVVTVTNGEKISHR